MTTKPTALPPAFGYLLSRLHGWTEQQLIDYGRAEYLRGLEDAVQQCEKHFYGSAPFAIKNGIEALAKEQQT